MSDIQDITLRIRVDIQNSAAINSLIQGMSRMNTAIQNTSKTQTAGNKINALASAAWKTLTGRLTDVERSLDAVFRAGVHMQAMGRDLMGFARNMIGLAAGMTTEWGKFEFTLNRAAAAAGVYDTQAEMYGRLKDAVYAAAHELRLFDTETVAKGLYFWQSTTGDVIDTQEQLATTMQRVTAVMKLAAMTDSNYETVIKGVYSVLKQFNLGMDETENVTSLLYYATQKTALELPDLINAFKMAGSVMGNAQEPLTTMVAVLGAIGNAGFRGSMAGRALRQTYIKLVKPTVAAKDALDELFKSQGGYNKVAFDSKGNFIGLEGYMLKMAAATKDMTYQQRAHLLAVITTANELPVMTQMLAAAERAVRSGSTSWIDAMDLQARANEVFQKSWEELAGSWRGVVGGLKNAVAPIFMQIGATIAKVLTPSLNELNVVIWDNVPAFIALAESIVESFRPAIEFVGKFVHDAIAWAMANKNIVKSFARWAVIGTIVSGVAGAFLLLTGTIVTLLANLALLLIGMAPLIVGLAAVITFIVLFAKKVYENVGGIQQAFNRFMPAILRFLKLFFFGSEDASKGVFDLASTIDRFVTGAVENLAKALEKATVWLNSMSPEDIQHLKDVAVGIGKVIFAIKLLSLAISGIGMVASTLNGAAASVKLAADGVKASFELMKLAALGGRAAFATLSSGVASGVSAVVSGVSGLAGAVKAIPAIFGAIRVALAGFMVSIGPIGWAILAIVAIVAVLVAAYETNFLGFKDIVDGVVKWFVEVAVPWIGQATSDVLAFFGALPGNIATFLGEVWANITNFVSTVLAAIGAFLKDLWENWSYYLGFIIGFVIGWIAKMIYNIVSFGIELGQNILNFISKLPGLFAEWFIKVGLFLSGWFFEMIPKVAGWAFDMITGIAKFFLELPGKIAGVFLQILGQLLAWFVNDAPKVIASVGQFILDILQFFINLPANILAHVDDIIDTLRNFFFGAITFISDSLTAIGGDIVRGIWNGITGLFGWFWNKITGFFSGIIDGVKSSLGISSPSKVFAEIGKNMILGVAKGIEASSAAEKALTGVFGDLTTMAAAATTSLGIQGTTAINIAKSTAATREINLNVAVTSPDGSVSDIDMDTLAGLITGSDMADAIKRMAAVE